MFIKKEAFKQPLILVKIFVIINYKIKKEVVILKNRKAKIVWKSIMLVLSIILIVDCLSQKKYGASIFWSVIALVHSINIFLI